MRLPSILLLLAMLIACFSGCAVHGDEPNYWLTYTNETDGYQRLTVPRYGGRDAARYAEDQNGNIVQDEQTRLPPSTAQELMRLTADEQLEFYQDDSDAYTAPYDIVVRITSQDNSTTTLFFNQGQDLAPETRELLDALDTAQTINAD